MVITLGETMVLLVPTGRLRTADRLYVTLAGAESSVAAYLAGLGTRASWRSRIGNDPWGGRVADELTARGVILDVEIDPQRPTGVFFKDPAPGGTRVHYYRAGSAASAMGRRFLDGTDVPPKARVLHTSGINAGLGPSPLRMCRELRSFADDHRLRWSFDVNFRPGLWSAEDAAPVLLELARQADIVFVGRDEAERLWGGEWRGALLDEVSRPGREVVVKDGPIGATCHADGEETFVATPPVHVVEEVGAGDAFAAGYLAASLAGRTPADRLALGHKTAALALGVAGDLAPAERIEALGESFFAA